MAEKKRTGAGTSLITESNADNPNLEAAIQQANRNYQLGRRNFRIDTTAMTLNPRPIYRYRTPEDAAAENQNYRLWYGAGWSLSPEDVALIEEAKKDASFKKLNERIWKAMLDEGMTLDKSQPQYKNVEIVDVDNEE